MMCRPVPACLLRVNRVILRRPTTSGLLETVIVSAGRYASSTTSDLP